MFSSSVEIGNILITRPVGILPDQKRLLLVDASGSTFLALRVVIGFVLACLSRGFLLCTRIQVRYGYQTQSCV